MNGKTGARGPSIAPILGFSLSLALIVGLHATVWPAIRVALEHRYPTYGLWRLTSNLLRDALAPALPWVLGGGGALTAVIFGLTIWRPPWRAALQPKPLVLAISGLGLAHFFGVALLWAWPTLDRPVTRETAPDVILIVVDTLRADHLGFSGYPRPTSPHLDQLAAESITFEQAYAHAPWTSPSVGALMTSKYPATLGYADSKDPAIAGDDALFMAEILAEHGYRTQAVISHTFIGSQLGFQQGMATFDEDNALGPLHISSESVTDKAIDLLDNNPRDVPFLLFLHYFDPHFSYIMHEDFDFDPDYEGEVTSGEAYGSLVERARQRSLSERDVQYLHALYDSEIRFTDLHIGRLLDHLRRLGLYDDAILIFTADHGEAFLDRKDRWIGHGKTLFSELIHVPLLIKLPAGQSAGTRVSTPVALVDVVPSLLDVLGLPAPQAAGLEGRALPLAQPDALRQLPAEPVFAETMARKRWLQSIVHGRWKLIADRKNDRLRLFDLETDPKERRNLAAKDPETAERLAKTLRSWNARMNAERREGARPSFTDEELERLRALGYLQ